MANDNLGGRRKRGMPEKAAMDYGPVKAGTRAFGERAAARREGIAQRSRKGDLRLKTAGKTVKGARDTKNRYLMGD